MKVIVYSAQVCPWCGVAKDFLRKHNIDFTEVDVSANRENLQELMEKSGQTGVPVIDIDGKIIIGFDEFRLKQAIGLKA
ncbi:MAG: glutathione S-transferase N-terminal domain-containing protein [Candidatus Diapherotrites archaeon]|nr:glutathione S-transferase N-terminal domain-containing protein [Candidatus Diapherotrites archaeon]